MILPEFAGHGIADEGKENLDEFIATVGGFAIVKDFAMHEVVAEIILELGGELIDEARAATEGFA